MSETTKPETVTKKRVLIETRVVIEPGWMGTFASEEARAKHLEKWANEIEDFFRDHRHQDVNSVRAERVYEIQCTGCGREWEEELYEDDGKWHCANCGKEIEVTT